MTMEELKETKSVLIRTARRVALTDEQSDSFKKALNLIDAEIARQNITDGEISQLIADIKNWEWFCSGGDTDESNMTEREKELIITALQAYRTEPCEWCEEDEPDFHVMAWQEPEDDEIDSESWVEIVARHCPNCGRRINGGLRNE